MSANTKAEEPLADDLLKGAKKIGEYNGDNLRRTYHLLETGQIPAGLIGGIWVASRRKLRAHFDRLTSGK